MLPVIDVSNLQLQRSFNNAGASPKRSATLMARPGFAYIANHGVARDVMDGARDAMTRLFRPAGRREAASDPVRRYSIAATCR